VILGTAAYMSPEQAKGKPVDKRADIWAFGCVLYECLTGEGAFQGETITEIVAAILKSEPDWSQLPKDTPALVRSLLQRCLQKDPSLRLHDIADARIEIGESIGQPLETVTVARRFSFGWLATGAAIILLAGLLIDLAVRKSTQPAPSFPVVRALIKLESGHWLDGWRWSPPAGFDQPTRTAMAISSDGRFIVYSAIAENPGPQVKSQLYLRRSDQLEAKPIPGTEGGISPFLSPDDRWVGFWADSKLMKVSIDGGVPVTLCEAATSFGASWGPENSIVFPPGWAGLSRVSADSGKPEILTTPDKTKGEGSHRLPHFLPGGTGVLFTIMRERHILQPRVALLDLKTRKWSVLLEDAADARYVPTGHLVFLRQGTLMVAPFDLKKPQLPGQPVPTISNVMQAINIPYSAWGTAAGQFSISDSGWLVYASGGLVPDWENSLVWVDQKGTVQPVASFRSPFYAPKL
jgi:serine/threonine-protein kinase